MGHTTDDLTDLAYQVSRQPPDREMDMLLTAGERISMALLSIALADQKIPAISLTGSQSGIITDRSHRRARIQRILGDRVRAALAEKNVVIVAGFQGVSDSKEVTTLGRGGSDTTAVALAASLSADFCDIYTDVDGVYSADPRIVQKPHFWKAIPHDLMLEMATRGVGVLHPRSVELAQRFEVPLRVRNSLNENQGTVIMSRSQMGFMEEYQVTAVTADDSKILLRVTLTRPTVLGALWACAAKSHLTVLCPFFTAEQVCFYSDRDAEADWRKHLEALSVDGFIQSYSVLTEVIPLSIVGDRFAQDGLALQEVMEVLSGASIPAELGSASSLAITVGIPKKFKEEGVRVLHQAFFSSTLGRHGNCEH
jgi:aspartate kinase